MSKEMKTAEEPRSAWQMEAEDITGGDPADKKRIAELEAELRKIAEGK